MTTISTIISDAFRESNLTMVGTSPTSAEETEALRLLNRVVLGLFGDKLGEPLNTLPLGRGTNIETPELVPLFFDDYITTDTVPANTRLNCNLTAATEINLDPRPDPGARFAVIDNAGNFDTYNLTVNGNGNQIETASGLTLSTANLAREWFFREDTGNWARLTDLITTDESPFPSEFDDILIIGLAFRLNPRDGAAVSPYSVERYREVLSRFQSRYRQTKEVLTDPALLRISAGRYPALTVDDGTAFNRGY